MYEQDNNSLPVWIILSPAHHHISINSQPFLVGIVSKANIGKRRNVYATNIDDTYIDSPTPYIDHVPDSPYGGIDLPLDEFYQVHALSSRHPPSQRPGQPSRPPFRPQSQHPRPTKPIRRYDGPIFLPPQIYKLLSEDADMFLSMFRLCSCGTKPQRSENHHFVMMSSWEPQCHHDIIMRTPRITGKPKFSWSGGL